MYLFKDFMLVVEHISRDINCEYITLGSYYNNARHLMAGFLEVRLEYVERNSNFEANNLA